MRSDEDSPALQLAHSAASPTYSASTVVLSIQPRDTAAMSLPLSCPRPRPPRLDLPLHVFTIAWLPIAALIFASNVVFPSAGDAVSSVTGNLYLMAVFLVIGAVAGRACARTGTLIAAVATAGAIMAGLANATFAVIDNDFPGIVGTQPEKAAEFRASGMTSMQDFLNLSHRRALAPFRAGIRCAAGFTATSAAPGWSCALIGGLAGRIAGWSAWYSFGDPEGLVRLVPRAGRPG